MDSSALVQFFQTSPVPAEAVSNSLWLIVAFPLAGALICGVLGKWLGRENTNVVACASVLGAFVLSLLGYWAINDQHTTSASLFSTQKVLYALSHDYGTWFEAGGFKVHLGMRVDHLSGTLLLVVSGVGFLIHLYSTAYMEHDEGYWRFFAYLNLFVAAMLTLVLADNMLMLFIGWEGVGLCSYLLIGFWYTDSAKAWAGRKAFIVNRIGDLGLLIGMFLLVLWVQAFNSQASRENFPEPGTAETFRTGLTQQGPLDFQGLEEAVHHLPPGRMPVAAAAETPIRSGPLTGMTFGGALTVILLLFMLGAAGKSAQLPLYVWLPDAMAGPTPVSALIHAATMVTAGVYLFCRLNFLLVLSPTAMAVIAVVGALTALFAAVLAFAQDDIKKVLAYSTISQLGFMFLGVGMGVFWAAIFHLVTHAFFKACLFLGAGSVMHGNGDETDIKRLGGLRKEMKWTWLTFLVATLAITGIFPLSGFFSKDAILFGAESTTLRGFAWVTSLVHTVGLVAAACTAFYMTRLYLLTFHGKRSPLAKVPHAHESSWAMTVPLGILALLSAAGALYMLPMPGTHSQPMIENFLWPVFLTGHNIAGLHQTVLVSHEGSLLEAWVIAWLIAVASGGAAAFAYLKYFPSRVGKPVPAIARAVRSLVQNKFYVDEAYDFFFVKPVKFISFILFKVVDSLLIDTVGVRGTAWVTSRVGSLLRYAQTGDAQVYAGVMALAVLVGVGYVFITFVQVLK